MKQAIIVLGLVALLGGCAAEVDVQTAEVEQSAMAVSPADCAAQQDECFSKNPLFGLLTCPLQFTECLATADSGLPAAVVSAATSATACASDLAACELAATRPSEMVACAETGAWCVADVVGVTSLPAAVAGTSGCVFASVECIELSTSVGDLAACADTLAQCTVDEAAAALPDGIGTVVTDISDCQFELTDCVANAAGPADIVGCGEQDLACVASGIGVDVDVTLASDAAVCAEDGAACVLAARAPSDIVACGEGLVSCVEAPIAAAIDCEAEWTACLLRNPFGFFACGDAYASCIATR